MWGRIEKKVSGDTTYLYMHKLYEAADDDEDWYGIRIVTDGDDKEIKIKRGSFSNYLTENWND